ncbi:MAG: hypothetical protein RR769_06800 [Anaerovoracaceae bacterium]
MGILFLTILAIPFILLFVLGVPIVIGVFVYKDAVKRETNPWLWTIVAALTPSFIGLIVYLIVRNDYPLKGTNNFNYQTSGQNTYGENTYEQKTYTNEDGEAFSQTVTPNHSIPTWGKVLIIIGCVLIFAFIVTAIISMLFSVIGYIEMPMHSEIF